jgi:RHS repeat-associated protein
MSFEQRRRAMKMTRAGLLSLFLIDAGCDWESGDAGTVEQASSDAAPESEGESLRQHADIADDFDRPDGPELGRTPVGDFAWRSDAATAFVSEGTLAPSPDGVELAELTVDDFVLKIRVRGEAWSVVYREADGALYRVAVSEGAITLLHGDEQLASADLPPSAEPWRSVGLVVEGESHRVEIDGAAVLDAEHSDGPLEGGFRLRGSPDVAYDDLEIFLGPQLAASTGVDADGVGGGGASIATPGVSGGGGEGGADGGVGPAIVPFGGGSGGSATGGSAGDGGDDGPPEPTDDDIRGVAAPGADLTVPTTLYKMTRFLFEGPSPEQVGADLQELTPSRIALVHGFVRDAWGQPLAGVEVYAVGHPEFGTTQTRSDGSYDFVVTGGLPLALALAQEDYLTAHRHVVTKAGDSHRMDDALLLPTDPESSLIVFDDPIEVHHAFTLNDGLPDRMATIMFRQGTQATMVFADETTQPLPEMTVRLTEYTVGEDGPDRMPARLPPGTMYNYALEISADEAEAAGAVSVELDTPAVLYVDNFLNWPVGVSVPFGTYDRTVGRWKAEPDGRVIEIVDIDVSGRAQIDIDYDADSQPATDPELQALGFTDDERIELASIYAVGARLWRTPVAHFTPDDINPSAASNGEPPPDGRRPDEGGDPNSCEGGGSILEYDDQGLGERLPIAGTPFTLEYRSGRMRGAPNRGMRVDVTGADPPADLLGAMLIVEVAGRRLRAPAPPAPHSYAELQWDGLDAYGRPVQGPHPVDLCVSWTFPNPSGVVMRDTGEGTSFGGQPPGAFGVHVQGNPFNGPTLLKCYGNGKSVAAANNGAITAANKFTLGGLDAQTISDGLGGWTVDAHHTLARATSTLYLGDGREREVSDEALWTAQRFAGNRITTEGALVGPATGAFFNDPSAIAADRQGNVYIGTPGLVRRILTDGTAEVVAGTINDPQEDGLVSVSNPTVIGGEGDGGPATEAELGNYIGGVAVDSAGGVYIADNWSGRIRYVDPAGMIDTIAGSGATVLTPVEDNVYAGMTPSGGDPMLASMAHVHQLALTPDEDGLLIAQGLGGTAANGFVRLLTHDGKLMHIAGHPAPSFLGDLNLLRPSLPCEPMQCSGAIGPAQPYNTMPSLASLLETPEDPSSSHHVRAEWAQLRGLHAVAVHEGRIYLGEDPQSPGGVLYNNGSIRVIDGVRGGPIYAFRMAYNIPEEPPYPCTGSGCNWEPTSDLPVERINSLHVDDDGVFFTTAPCAACGEPRLARAVDEPSSTIETLLGGGGPDADTFMCASGPCDGSDDVFLGRDLRIGRTHVTRGPDGALYVADEDRNLVYRVARAVPPMYVSSWLNSEDGSEVYLFDDEGRHLETRDARTHELIWGFEYDSAGLLIGITDQFSQQFGNVVTINRAAGVGTSIVSRDGQTTTLGYDGNGYLDTVTDPEAAVTSFSYTETGLMTSMSDSDSESIFDYDARGRLETDDATVRYDGSIEGTVAQTLERTENTPTAASVLHTSGAGIETSYRRERTGPSSTDRLVSWPDGTQTSGTHSPDRGTVTYPDGTSITTDNTVDLRLGANTRVPARIDVSVPGVGTSGVSFGRSYSRHCQVFTEDCDPFADPDLYADEIVETVTVETATEGSDTWTETFQRAHLESGSPVPATIVLSTPLGRTSTTTLNDDGDVDTITVADLAPVAFDYDLRGRLETVTRTDGVDTRSTTLTYNADGFVETVTDALDRTTSYLYDEFGRVERQTFPDGRFVVFNYDDDGNLTSVTPPGRLAHEFTHDSLDRTRTYEPPIGIGVPDPETIYAYNADHQPVLVTRPDGQTLDIDYDPTSGKLELVTIPTGAYDYSYKTTGQLDAVTDPDEGSLAYEYFASLLARETLAGDINGSVSWTYDSRHRLRTESVNDAQSITIEYDEDGTPETIGALSLTPDPINGQLVATAVGSVTTAHDYNDFGEPVLTSYIHGGSTALYDLALTRDEVGRIKTKSETRASVTTLRCYEYDDAGRLTDVYDAADSMGCTGTRVEHYGYDANGNRNEVDNGALDLLPGDFEHDDQDRLIEYGDVGFTYTENGEVETMTDPSGTTDFVYDAMGNLQSVELPDGTDIEYIYDARDRRVGKRVNDVLVQGFLYGDQLEPIAELNAAGTVVSRFVYGTRAHVPDYMVRDGNTYRIITDHLGSVVAVVNTGTGAVVEEITYDAWGRVLSDTNSGFQPFYFAGGVLDEHTGWLHFGARDYDPETGRWAAKDPLRFAAGDSNLYSYAFGDPVNMLDPSGLDPWYEDAFEFWGHWGNIGGLFVSELGGASYLASQLSGGYSVAGHEDTFVVRGGAINPNDILGMPSNTFTLGQFVIQGSACKDSGMQPYGGPSIPVLTHEEGHQDQSLVLGVVGGTIAYPLMVLVSYAYATVARGGIAKPSNFADDWANGWAGGW